LEYPLYHACGEQMVKVEFLAHELSTPIRVELSESERQLKENLYRCFPTQIHFLKDFPAHAEQFRVAPDYDFAEPPHEGRLFYEFVDWGMHGDLWRTLAKSALETLGLARPRAPKKESAAG